MDCGKKEKICFVRHQVRRKKSRLIFVIKPGAFLSENFKGLWKRIYWQLFLQGADQRYTLYFIVLCADQIITIKTRFLLHGSPST